MPGRGRRRIRSRKLPEHIRQGVDIKDAIKGLDRFGDAIYQKALRAGRGAAVRVVMKEARSNTHVAGNRTGNLREGLKVKSSKTRASLESHAPHSYVVERGHGGPRPAPPHPFLEAAVMGTRQKQLRAAAAAIDRAAKRAQSGPRTRR